MTSTFATAVHGILLCMSEAMSSSDFGILPDGSAVKLYTIRSGNMEAVFSDYGARLVSLSVPDRNGVADDVVLGYATLEEYIEDKTFAGATIGRFGNRLAQGRFSIDGVAYQVPLNDGPNALHGGPEGFDRRVWCATSIENGVAMTLVSPDGDQGFPGELTVTVRFTLDDDELFIEYTATTDKPTILNLTNHSYFNLAGESSGTILDHEIHLPAETFTPVNATLIPAGELATVEGTPFDFRTSTRIGERIEQPDVQLQRAGGYDHNWCHGESGTEKIVAVLTEPKSGRVMVVETTEPGVQFYSGNFIDGSMKNGTGGIYMRRAGLCLETQHYPDSPNQPEFPSTVLRPGEEHRSSTVYSFSTKE